MPLKSPPTKRRGTRLLALLPLLAACGGGTGPEPGDAPETGTQQSSVILGANRYGLVTGGIYNAGAQPLSDATARAKFFCEMRQLNAKWLRIEAAWPGVSSTTYQQIVADAHANGIKVIVLYTHPQFCGDPNSGVARDTYINDYITNKVNAWTYNVFNTTYNGWSTRADAIEVMNEPNIAEPCPDGSTRFRVEPNTFAWTVRRVKEWKQSKGRTELIISGGILNTYTNEAFWPGLFNSGALTAYKGNPPWDYFGIHPYNPWSYDWNCLNSGGGSACFGNYSSGYKYTLRTGLQTVQSNLNTATGVTNNRLFVTEFGFQDRGTVSAPDNAVRNEAEVAEGLRISAESFGDSGVVDYALWYTYRNHTDGSGNFGLRNWWNGSTHYPSKWEPWHEFQKLAKGLTARTGDSPDACWL
ncbi:hypothetical protein [Archangium sp.]|uniref:hypothetical protein n=1 Tax=Archangium sp. TaxID=1872627 RepID=UPI002D40C905|nr:hypothetical protein [Archangium sp.]HYO58943.1 hypothetical protein [Archangium sp.]